MKKKFIAGMIGITLLLLVGCGAKENEQQENGVMEETLQEDTTDKGSEEMDEQIPLSKDELQQWSDYVTTKSGFLLSYYDTADKIDLNELFYSGCGLEQEPLTEQEIEAYLNLIGAEEIYTECIKLTTSQIESVLQTYLGFSLNQMKKPLEWVYLEETDCYVAQHGDTNATRFTCTSGYKQGNQVTLNCVAMESHALDCRVTLQKVEDDNWQFVANEKIENLENAKAIWQIDEQSFEVELNEWGNVTFVSYAPEASIGVFYPPSVSFELFQNGESIYQFPEALGEELLETGGTFEEVRAVSFQDINADGYKDVIVIIGYEEGNAVRIYSGSEADFCFMEELSAFINAEGKNQTIQEVIECASTWQPGEPVSGAVYGEIVSVLGETAASQIRIMAQNSSQWKIKEYGPAAGNYAVYDLDVDGRLELMTSIVQGTGIYSDNHFYQINTKNTGLIELNQVAKEERIIEFEIGDWGYDKQGKAYIEEKGRILYAAADYGKEGAWFTGCSEGCYYLENGMVVSEEVRMHTIDFSENEDGLYTYYRPDSQEPISKEEWELLYENFMEDKQETDIHIEWKSLYEEEAENMSVDDWFLLLAESYRNAIFAR